MTDAIGPGVYVECVNEDQAYTSNYGGPIVSIGDVLCVEQVVPGAEYYDGIDGLEFIERPQLDPDGIRVSWVITMFRPIYRRDESLIARLLTKLPAEKEIA